MRFGVLASGSRGNSAVVRLDGPAVLVDVGLGPRIILDRLGRVGMEPGHLGAVVLSHTHGDHVSDDTLRLLAAHRVRLFCHEGHLGEMSGRRGFSTLDGAGLIRSYDDRPFLVAPGLWAEAIELSHSGPTFGFRFQGRSERGRKPCSLGYLTDSGCWDERTADALTDVDLLAVESNHDVNLTWASGRHPRLIARNLGPFGHLSNEQAAGLVEAVLKRSASRSVRRVVLLHLSRDCNRPELALAATRSMLRACGRRSWLHAASFDEVLPPFDVGALPALRRA